MENSKSFWEIGKDGCLWLSSLDYSDYAEYRHSPTVVLGVVASCTQSGLTEGSVCSDCAENVRYDAVLVLEYYTQQITQFPREK